MVWYNVQDQHNLKENSCYLPLMIDKRNIYHINLFWSRIILQVCSLYGIRFPRINVTWKKHTGNSSEIVQVIQGPYTFICLCWKPLSAKHLLRKSTTQKYLPGVHTVQDGRSHPETHWSHASPVQWPLVSSSWHWHTSPPN